ncbi:hypothetical protein MMC19_007090 [Ptychographa xylographoides]|nr:hypothetical protein [Ptychographa xylographoides]
MFRFGLIPLCLAALFLLAIPRTSQAQMMNGTTYDVTVGNGALVFNPPILSAMPGDKVNFHYYPNNHSVAQSSFGAPCVPLNQSAIFSGFMPVPVGSVGQTVFTITVNDTKPIWLYCSQARHCESGMAMVINQPVGANSLAAYLAAATRVNSTISPAAIGGGVFSAAISNSTSMNSTTTTSSMPSMMTSMTSTTTYVSTMSNGMMTTVTTVVPVSAPPMGTGSMMMMPTTTSSMMGVPSATGTGTAISAAGAAPTNAVRWGGVALGAVALGAMVL